MQLSETITGEIAICHNDVTIIIKPSDAFELLCWLADRRDTLYQASKHGEDTNWHMDPSRDAGERRLSDEQGYAASLARSMSVLPSQAPEGAEQEADSHE